MKNKKKNKLIEVYKKYFSTYKKGLAKKGLNNAEILEEMKNRAYQTLLMIEDKRPNKDKSAYEQANDYQRECIDYLRNVEETGIL